MAEPRTPHAGRLPPPEHLSPSPPVPLPAEPVLIEERSPTRYGDWEYKGIAVDF